MAMRYEDRKLMEIADRPGGVRIHPFAAIQVLALAAVGWVFIPRAGFVQTTNDGRAALAKGASHVE